MKALNIKKGAIIYANPFFQDVCFGKSTILLTKHDKNGSVGFIVNKKLEITINDLLPEPISVDFDLFYGGPLSNDTLFFIHSIGNSVPDTFSVTEKIYWGGDFSYIVEIINNNKIDVKQLKFFIGYAGWGKDQLKDEIINDSWIFEQKATFNVFDDDTCKDVWRNKMSKMGSKYAVWANFPQNPSMN